VICEPIIVPRVRKPKSLSLPSDRSRQVRWPYSAGSTSSLLARSSHASAASSSSCFRRPISRSACASLSAAFSRHSAALNNMVGVDQTRRVESEQNRTRSGLFRIVLERDHQPGSTPKLNAARADKALCLLDCNRVVSTKQRFESVEMPVVPDEICPIFFHPDSPLRTVEPTGD
jgi:hypothetical protein